jgi:hypothetical protein
MSGSRKAFTEQLRKLGFRKFAPKGDIHKYIPKEYYKLDPIAVGISPRHSTIEITVYQLETKSLRKFKYYSEANSFLKRLKEDSSLMELPIVKAKRLLKVRRSNKKGSPKRA